MKYPLVYGSIAGAIAISVLVFGMEIMPGGHSLWFGYLVMLVALSLIFVGTKRYRDIERGGVISFSRAFGVGLGIALVAGVIYALGWELYLAVSGKDFMADYTASIIAHMRSEGATPAAINAKLAEMHSMAESYRNPLFRLMTFIEIFPVGLLVTLISAALLRNPRLLPAKA
jgi:hypothetical protein